VVLKCIEGQLPHEEESIPKKNSIPSQGKKGLLSEANQNRHMNLIESGTGEETKS